jgi:hypothetical protein
MSGVAEAVSRLCYMLSDGLVVTCKAGMISGIAMKGGILRAFPVWTGAGGVQKNRSVRRGRTSTDIQ